ncbi:MAG: hypothetical protein KIT24_03220 [Phycisphaeraceae bacterium]|nr:hypothetical protein [Phycisphaeraceae bacterium]
MSSTRKRLGRVARSLKIIARKSVRRVPAESERRDGQREVRARKVPVIRARVGESVVDRCGMWGSPDRRSAYTARALP